MGFTPQGCKRIGCDLATKRQQHNSLWKVSLVEFGLGEIAFTADSTYSLGVGNPRSRLDYSCLKKLLKVL